MTSKTVKVPECIKFSRAVWNSEPFIEHFLYNLRARRYYLLDESGCRNSLINLFSILDFWTMQTESQSSVRTICSSLCIILAVNIRERESVPLVQSFDEEEFATDPLMTQRFEQPISKRNQVSEEIQNAVRSVKEFDIIAPALAWAMVRFIVGGIAVADTLDSELQRWEKLGSPTQLPRGCVAFLERKLPFVKNFAFLPSDLSTLVKSTAVYLKNNASDSATSATISIRRQLASFTRCFVEKNLGPWIPIAEITDGSLERQTALMKNLQENCGCAKLAQDVDNLSLFHDNIAKHYNGFDLRGHHVYSVYKSSMLSFLNDGQGQNSELTAELHRVKAILSSARSFEDLDCEDAAEGELAASDINVRERAKRFLLSLSSEERLQCFQLAKDSRTEAGTPTQSTQLLSLPGKRKKRRKKKS